MIPAVVLTLLGILAAPHGYQVIVHDSNPLQDARVPQISALFLRRQAVWSDGRPVVPVDQAPQALVRQAFSVAVHGRPVQAVQAFWRQKVFAGEAVPPAELGSDADVIAYVQSHADAVGYVATGPLSSGVHAVRVIP